MRIVIAEDDALLREGLTLLLRNEGLEVAAAQGSKDLAGLSAANAQLRLERYKEFDESMDDRESSSFLGGVFTSLATVAAKASCRLVADLRFEGMRTS